MFPNFQNNPNKLPAIIETEAVLEAGFDTGFDMVIQDGTVDNLADFSVASVYEADGSIVANSDVTLATVDVLDGTNVASATLEVTLAAGTYVSPVTILLNTPGNYDAVVDSRDQQESELVPAAGTPGLTVKPTVDTDASAAANIPGGITDPVNAVDDINVDGYTAPDGNAENSVPSDLDPQATKRWN